MKLREPLGHRRDVHAVRHGYTKESEQADLNTVQQSDPTSFRLKLRRINYHISYRGQENPDQQYDRNHQAP